MLPSFAELERYFFLLVILLLPITSQIIDSYSLNSTEKRLKRHISLLFMNPSAITFICGFGIPVNNLNPELVTAGMVFKTQYTLPTSYKNLRKHTTHTINKRDTFKHTSFPTKAHSMQNSTGERYIKQNLGRQRTLFYKSLEKLSESFGHPGRQCVLKMICNAASTDFHYGNGILGDLIYILLTPSSSLDAYFSPSDYDYIKAEEVGRGEMECHKQYNQCDESILDNLIYYFD